MSKCSGSKVFRVILTFVVSDLSVTTKRVSLVIRRPGFLYD